MGNVTVVRPDGSTLNVSQEDAEKLRTLGYKDQSTATAVEGAQEEGVADYYTSGGQKLQTAFEGGLSGMTLGLSDLVTGDDAGERARYNPGLRLGSELVGSILPSIVQPETVLGKIAGATPVGLLTRGAETASEAVGGGKFLQGVTRGAIEGMGFGAGSALTEAKLNGDPLTAEAVLSGMGWGALWGGGFGAISGGIDAKLERSRLAKEATEKEVGQALAEVTNGARGAFQDAKNEALNFRGIEDSIAERHAGISNYEEHHFGQFYGAIDDARNTLRQAGKDIEASLKEMGPRAAEVAAAGAGEARTSVTNLPKATPWPEMDSLAGIKGQPATDKYGATRYRFEDVPGAHEVTIQPGTRVYHGTSAAEDFDMPKSPASFALDKDTATGYAQNSGDGVNPRVKEFVTTRPARVLDHPGVTEEGEKANFWLNRWSRENLGKSARDWGMIGYGKSPEALKVLKEAGYDGILIRKLDDGGSEIALFEPEKFASNTTERAPVNLEDIRRNKDIIYSKTVDAGVYKDAKRELKEMQDAYAGAAAAARNGNHAGMIKNLEKYQESLLKVQERLGPQAFNPEKALSNADRAIQEGKSRIAGEATQKEAAKAGEQARKIELSAAQNQVVAKAQEALKEATGIAAVEGALGKIPRTAEDFADMTTQRAEKIAAAIDKLMSLKSAELNGVKDSVEGVVDRMAERLSLQIEGGTSTKFRAIHEALKGSRSSRTQEILEAAAKGKLLWKNASTAAKELERAKARAAKMAMEGEKLPTKGQLPWYKRGFNRVAGYYGGVKAAEYANKMGGGSIGRIAAYDIGKNLTMGLIGLKGAVLHTVATKAGEWTPKVNRVLKVAGPRVEPLYTRLDGTQDPVKQSRQDLALARMKEIREALPVARDTLYRAVQPLSLRHPELAASLHELSVQQLQYLYKVMPKDPGLAFSNFKSLWKPDAVAVEKFARVWEVFHNPVGVINNAIQNGTMPIEQAEALKEMNPALFTEWRVAMLNRISDPAVRAKMSYQDQVHVGVMIGQAVHATMNPQFISAQQQMFSERNKPLEMNPRIQPGGGGGRPAGPGPSATTAQRITEH